MAIITLDEKDFSRDEENIFKIIFQIILLNKKFIAITFLSIVIGLYAVIANLTYQFESSAQLLVRLGRENVRTPLTVENGSVYSTGVKKEDINSYINLLSSEELVKKTISEVGYERFKFQPEPETIWQHIKFFIKSGVRLVKDQARNLMILLGLKTRTSEDQKIEAFVKKAFNVALLRESNVIQLSIKLPDAVLARDFIRAHIHSYHLAHINVNQRANFFLAFKEQTELYKEKLREKQIEMEEIKNEWNIISPKEQRIKIMGDMQVVRMKVEQKLARSKQLSAEKVQLEKLAAKTPQRYKMQEDYEPSPTSVLIKEELARLKIKRSKMEKLYTKNSKNTKLLDSRIKQIEQLLLKSEQEKISSAVSYQPNPLAETLSGRIKLIKVEMSGLEASIKQDEGYLSELKKEIGKLNRGTFFLSTKELEYSIIEEKYLLSATRLEQVKIDKQLDAQSIANVITLSPATLAAEPIAPRKSLLFFVGIIAALIVSCGVAIFKEWMIETIHDGDDINTLADIKFLGYFSV